ncbi:MAG TPA: TetR family transcriptional regulator [Marmoricola sp.]|nr:TetR family transcriptional regulator [Marmoricola sp.]
MESDHVTSSAGSPSPGIAPRAGLVALVPGYADRMAGSPGGWRDRLLAEAAQLTRQGGWQTLTMAKLADRVGVSRQTVYNEIGSKSQLAEAMVMRELEVFLQAVDLAFEEHPDDLVEALREAARRVLETARTNPLLHAVLSASHGAESDLLPLLTTQSAPLIEAARQMIGDHLTHYEVPLEEDQLDAAVDMVVRLVLSHVTLPSATPAETADQIAWIATKVLGGA